MVIENDEKEIIVKEEIKESYYGSAEPRCSVKPRWAGMSDEVFDLYKKIEDLDGKLTLREFNFLKDCLVHQLEL